MSNFYKVLKNLLQCFLTVALLSVDLFAGTTGKIAGRVVDAKTKEPLIGVNVLIVGTSMGGATDVDGNYFILNVPPGAYEVKASTVGYGAVVEENVRVSADQTTKLNFELSEQAVQVQTVVVTASKPIVQKDLTSTQSSISGSNISLLPVEDVQSVINLQAGVVDGHFRGGRLGEVKYLIDGVSVNDVYSGDATMEAATNSIQELQVITGTFNAEYGQAMSGVVNQITKIPEDHYNGGLSVYSGDYATSRTNLFQYMGGFNPSRTYNIQGNLSGPIPLSDQFAKFFASARYLSDDGYLYGKRVFNPQDSSNFSSDDPSKWYIGATGNGADVPMNFSRQLTLQGKLNFKVGQGRGIVLEGLYQKHDYENYDHMFILDPDGNYKNYEYSYLASLSYTHVFSESAFLDLMASNYTSDYKQYAFANPLDPQYQNQDLFSEVSGNALYVGGTQNWHFMHNTKTYTLKADFTDQLNYIHELKTGFEADLNKLNYQDFQVLVDASTGNKPALPTPGTFDYNVYNNHPYQVAAYIQDKIELDYLIVNVGLRFDYFQPDASVLNDPNNIAELDTLLPPFPSKYFHRASAKYQWSPRLGISYPMSDKGAIHISYGHFFQVPPFQYLYDNPNFRIPLTGNYPDLVGNTIGNADLKPQETVMYEIGLQQALTDDIGLNVTAYYKDIRNLLGVELFVKNNFKKFAEYINTDYGDVTGFTLSLDKKFTNGIGASVDYTFQVAKGDASDPNEAYNLAQASPPIEANKQLVSLDWDRRNSLNFTITTGIPGDFIASAVGQLGTGLPYTPSYQNQRTGLENSSNKPTFFDVDIFLTKYLKLFGINFSIFAKIYNVFDTPDELDVFTDTGRAGYTLDETRAQAPPRGVNTIQEYFTRPDFYSAPRQVLLGMSMDF
ncbi:MAG TPA: TonB-dependent receptor [Candidatus Kryptonia bacterium]